MCHKSIAPDIWLYYRVNLKTHDPFKKYTGIRRRADIQTQWPFWKKKIATVMMSRPSTPAGCFPEPLPSFVLSFSQEKMEMLKVQDQSGTQQPPPSSSSSLPASIYSLINGTRGITIPHCPRRCPKGHGAPAGGGVAWGGSGQCFVQLLGL